MRITSVGTSSTLRTSSKQTFSNGLLGINTSLNSYLESIIASLRSFYVYELHKILKSYRRGQLLSLILLVIYAGQLLGLFFTEEILKNVTDNLFNKADSLATICKYIQYFKLFPGFGAIIYENYTVQDSDRFNGQVLFLRIAAVVNIVLLSYLLIRAIYFMVKQVNNQTTIKGNQETFQEASINNSSPFEITLNIISSAIFRVYIFIFFIPFCEISLKVAFKDDNSTFRSAFDSITGIFTAITSLILAWLISAHDYDHSLIIRDNISSSSTIFMNSSIFFDFLSCFFLLFNNLAVHLVYYLINSICKLLILLKELPFNNKYIQMFFTQWTVFLLIFEISFAICSGSSEFKISFSILILALSPLSYGLSRQLDRLAQSNGSYSQFFIEESVNKIDGIKLSRYIRNLCNLFTLPYEDYMKSGQGLQFETIFANHLLACTEKEEKKLKLQGNQISHGSEYVLKKMLQQNGFQCFCAKYRDKDGFKQLYGIGEESTAATPLGYYADMQSEKSMQISMSEMSSLVKHNNNSNSQLMTPSEVDKQIQSAVGQILGEDYRKQFLVEHIGNLLQQYIICQSKHSNLILLRVICTQLYFLLQIAENPIKAFKQIIVLKDQMKLSSLQSQSMLQEIIEATNGSFKEFLDSCPFQNQRLQISAVYTFDKLFAEFKITFKEAITSKQSFFEFLSADYINLSELLKQSQICLSLKQLSEQKLIELFDLHPTHPKLQEIAELYIDLFDLRKRKVSKFIRQSKELIKKKLKHVDLKIDLFDMPSCVVFSSLHSYEITHVSDSAVEFFNISSANQNILGMQFVSLLPVFMSEFFNKFIENLLDERKMDVIKIGEYFTYICQQFQTTDIHPLVIPVYLRVKVDAISKDGEFGLSIFFKPCDAHRTSIITDIQYCFLAQTQSAQKLFYKFLQSNQYYQQQSPSLQGRSSQRKHSENDFMKGVILKNLIPYLYCLSSSNLESINNLDAYSENFGFKDQRSQKFQIHRSLLVLPTSHLDMKHFRKNLQESPKEISEFLLKLTQLHLEYYEITFSVFSITTNNPTIDKQLRVIDILSLKHLSRSHEVNQLISELKVNLEMKFSQTVYLPPFFANNTLLKEKKLSLLLSLKTLPDSAEQPANLEEAKLKNKQKSDNFSLNNINFNSSRDSPPLYEGNQVVLSNQISIEQGLNMKDRQLGHQVFEDNNSKIITAVNYEINNHSIMGVDNSFHYGNSHNMSNIKRPNAINTSITNVGDDSSLGFHSNRPLISPRFAGNDISNQQILQSESKDQIIIPPTSPMNRSTQQLMSTMTDRDIQGGNSNRESIIFFNQPSQSHLISPHSNNNISMSMANGIIVDDLEVAKPQKISTNKQKQKQKQGLFQLAQISSFKDEDIPPIFKNNLSLKQPNDSEQIQLNYYNSAEVTTKDILTKPDKQMTQSNQSPTKLLNLGKRHNSIENTIPKKVQLQQQLTQQKGIGEDQQSVSQVGGQSNSQIQGLFNIIVASSDPTEIQISKKIGIIAYLIIIITTFILFFQVKSNFDDQWIYYENLQIGPRLIEDYFQILHVKELLTVIQVNAVYHYLYSSFTTLEKTQLTTEAYNKVNNITKVVVQLEQVYSKQGFEDFLVNNSKELVMQSVVSSTYVYNVTFNILYSLVQFPPNLFEYLKSGEVFSRRLVYLNYLNYIDTSLKLQVISTTAANTKLDDTQTLLYYSLGIIELVCFFSVLTIFPIYYVIQVKKQDILNLLVTFNPNLLKSLVNKYKDSAQLKILAQNDIQNQNMSNSKNIHNQLSKHLQLLSSKSFKMDKNITQNDLQNNSNSNNINNKYKSQFSQQNQNQSKRKQISQTKSLPKFSNSLFLMGLLMFLLISLYSFLSYMLTKDFFKMFKYHIDEMSFVTQTKALLASNYMAIFLLFNSYAYALSDDRVDMVLNFFPSFLLPDDNQRIQKLSSIDNNFVENRYLNDQYYPYFLDIIQKDACPMLQSSYAQDLLQYYPLVDINKCNTIAGGILSKGFAIAYKALVVNVNTIVNNYVATRRNAAGFFQKMYKWDMENNIKDFDLVYYYIRCILDAQTNFLIAVSRKYFDYLMSVQEILFIYSIVAVTCIFLIAWHRFLAHMAESIQKTTFLLSLMPIDNLLENPYVISYLNRQKYRVRQRGA